MAHVKRPGKLSDSLHWHARSSFGRLITLELHDEQIYHIYNYICI